MLLAFGVYLGLLITMYGFAKLAVKCRPDDYWKISIIPILLYSCIIGLRYDVGIDYMTYVENFQNFASSLSHDNFEWLFRNNHIHNK